MANNKKKTPVKKTTRPKKKTVAAEAAPVESSERLNALTETNRHLKRKIFDLYTIFEINRNFNAVLDYQQLLDTFLFTSLAQVSALKAAIYLEDEINSDNFEMAKHRGSGKFPSQNQVFKKDTTLTNYLKKLNRPVRVEEITDQLTNESEQKILDHFSPGLVIPLIYQTRLTGLFLITDKMSNRPFIDDDLEFLSILANQISVAIENTRLYSAEKLASQQLRATQQQLVHSERLAALGEMSAKIAHEINNPLGIIKNYLLLTKNNLENTAAANENISIVSEEIDRIAKIVKELLDFHRPRGFEVKKVDVAKVLSDILILTERKLEAANIKLIKHFKPECQEIEASVENLKQVFLNLIINAIDVMEEGGELTVTTECNEEFVTIEFSDTGPGIAPEIIPRIFEPFFTTKSPTKGTGLGLSVCYGIIKRHNGEISFKNLKKGGCFRIDLPIRNSNKSYEPNI